MFLFPLARIYLMADYAPPRLLLSATSGRRFRMLRVPQRLATAIEIYREETADGNRARIQEDENNKRFIISSRSQKESAEDRVTFFLIARSSEN